MSIKLSILIVSYNTRECTIACLQSVYEQTRETGFEVIVVDNLSTDGSADAIASRFPQVKLVRHPANAGFAGGNNIGAAIATGRYLLLLNPDTVVLDGALDKLMAFAEAHPSAGIWGGRTLFPDRTLNPTYCWKRQTLWSATCCATGLSSMLRGSRVFDPESMGAWNTEQSPEVDIVSGCFLLIKRELWDRLDGLDPYFFVYGEEADLCLRARALGVRPRITLDATIIHLGGASEPVRSDKLVRLIKAKVQLIRRHWSPGLAPVGVGLLTAWPLSRAIVWWLLAPARGKAGRESAASWSSVWRRRREWLEASVSPLVEKGRTSSVSISTPTHA